VVVPEDSPDLKAREAGDPNKEDRCYHDRDPLAHEYSFAALSLRGFYVADAELGGATEY
jgi:hypothetical protein